MVWLQAFTIAVAAFNIGLGAYQLHRHRRLLLAERLLMDLAQQSFVLAHRGTWRAWADSMGQIEVTVELLGKSRDQA